MTAESLIVEELENDGHNVLLKCGKMMTEEEEYFLIFIISNTMIGMLFFFNRWKRGKDREAPEGNFAITDRERMQEESECGHPNNQKELSDEQYVASVVHLAGIVDGFFGGREGWHCSSLHLLENKTRFTDLQVWLENNIFIVVTTLDQTDKAHFTPFQAAKITSDRYFLFGMSGSIVVIDLFFPFLRSFSYSY
ncbi:hypothetical protein ACJX0J_035894, partial [Zea mays]